jgi:RNA polymerase sigma-70 factor (ECF subfamily)
MDPDLRGWKETIKVALSEIDRRLMQRCLAGEPRSWEEFIDRFMGLVLHVVDHTARARSLAVSPEDRDDLVSDVFLEFVADDLRVLRNFRGESSLATYLTVVARRVVVRNLARRHQASTLEKVRQAAMAPSRLSSQRSEQEQRIIDLEELERLLTRLNGPEAEVVRMYHLEGKSYREISDQVGMPENTIGPTLSRARLKMRQASADSTM